MARYKQSFIQRDFSAGVLREDFLERDDTELRRKSLRDGENLRTMLSGGIEARPGLVYMRDSSNARSLFSIRVGTGTTYGLMIGDTAMRVINDAGTTIWTSPGVPWTDGSLVWVTNINGTVILGSTQIAPHILEFVDGAWVFTSLRYEPVSGRASMRPFWSFRPGTTITPSASGGAVTVVASDPVFTTDHVGKYIRYGGREINLTGYTNATTMTGTTRAPLPPSIRLNVASTAQIAAGDVVIGQDSGWRGLVSVVNSATQFDTLTLENFDGPTIGEKISSGATTQVLDSKGSIPPVATQFWDEQLISPANGFPGSGTSAAGRLVLSDFARAPNLVAISSARGPNDFTTGIEDDDAIIRTVGDDSPRFRHVIAATDLLLFSDRGIYVAELKETPLTPNNFNPIRFDARGANAVRPVMVDDAVVFVEKGGTTVSAAMLSGNVYLKWSIFPLTNLHSQQIRRPVSLCGPPDNSDAAERYVLIVNNDGTISAASWSREGEQQGLGFIPWTTQGTFKFAAPVLGEYAVLVERELAGGTQVALERFDFERHLDCSRMGGPAGPLVPHLAGQTAYVVASKTYGGTAQVAGNGSLPDVPSMGEYVEAGLNFDAFATMWPIENIQSPRIGMLTVRVFRFIASLQHAGAFRMRANAQERELGGYQFGTDLSVPPELDTRVYRIPVTGRRDHPELTIKKHMPGPFRVLALGQEVQG